jgi:hypothetical protein
MKPTERALEEPDRLLVDEQDRCEPAELHGEAVAEVLTELRRRLAVLGYLWPVEPVARAPSALSSRCPTSA